MWKYNQHLRNLTQNVQVATIKPPPEMVAAWFPRERKWPAEDLSPENPLKVHFLNSCLKEWKQKIENNDIIQILDDTWSACFVEGTKDDSQIRVKFQGMHTSLPLSPYSSLHGHYLPSIYASI